MHLRNRIRRPLLLAVLGSCLANLVAAPAHAQSLRGRPPAPQAISLTTKDGVEIKGTYYPSNVGRDAVPVVLLHDFNESRAVLNPLAKLLNDPPPPPEEGGQKPLDSRAVIAIDLRGHGESKTAFAPDGAAIEFDAQRLALEDFQDMVLYDLEAVRAFLITENDKGNLNLNKLCVVGVGMGANVAVLWTARDWAAPPLAVRKQGQDVKAMVLISPRWNYRGLALVEAMKFPPVQREVGVFLAFGADDPQFKKDGQNLNKVFSKYHAGGGQSGASSFVLVTPKTKLQGSALLLSRQFSLVPRVVDFVDAQLGAAPYPYLQRRK